MTNGWEISILGVEDEDFEEELERGGDRGWRRSRAEVNLVRNTVGSATIRERLVEFLNAMSDAISGIPEFLGPLYVSEIELSAEISASGKISLMGSGAEIGSTGGISFKLVRRTNDAHKEATEPIS